MSIFYDRCKCGQGKLAKKPCCCKCSKKPKENYIPCGKCGKDVHKNGTYCTHCKAAENEAKANGRTGVDAELYRMSRSMTEVWRSLPDRFGTGKTVRTMVGYRCQSCGATCVKKKCVLCRNQVTERFANEQRKQTVS